MAETQTDVCTMPAGRELDALVAERVMGLVPCDKWAPRNLGSAGGPVMMSDHANCTCMGSGCYPSVPDLDWPGNGPQPYSSEISAAWLVVERMVGPDRTIEVGWDGTQWFCVIEPLEIAVVGDTLLGCFDARADTAPLAIVRAALLALDAH